MVTTAVKLFGEFEAEGSVDDRMDEACESI
jgi:hypothetical protein